jgi:hypothetical protein
MLLKITDVDFCSKSTKISSEQARIRLPIPLKDNVFA